MQGDARVLSATPRRPAPGEPGCGRPRSGAALMTAQPVVLGPGQGWQFWTSVIHGTVKAESGKGHFSIYESSPPPGGPGPAPHIHRSYVEEWLAAEGTGPVRPGEARLPGDAGSLPSL